MILSQSPIPIDVDTGLGEHEKPEVEETWTRVHGSETVVDEQAPVWKPQSGENDDDNHQHLNYL